MRAPRSPVAVWSCRVVSCPVWFRAPLPPRFVRAVLCVRNSVTCTFDGGGRAVPCTLIYDPLENTSGTPHPFMLTGLGTITTIPHYTSTDPYGSQTPSATEHALYLVTPTRETPTRETPTRETRPQHVCVCVLVCVHACARVSTRST